MGDGMADGTGDGITGGPCTGVGGRPATLPGAAMVMPWASTGGGAPPSLKPHCWQNAKPGAVGEPQRGHVAGWAEGAPGPGPELPGAGPKGAPSGPPGPGPRG